MYFERHAFLGQIPLLGQTKPPAPPPAAPPAVAPKPPAAPPPATQVTAAQFQKMSSMERSKVLDGLSPEQACVLYTELYALTKDPKDQAFMKSWCKVAGK